MLDKSLDHKERDMIDHEHEELDENSKDDDDKDSMQDYILQEISQKFHQDIEYSKSNYKFITNKSKLTKLCSLFTIFPHYLSSHFGCCLKRIRDFAVKKCWLISGFFFSRSTPRIRIVEKGIAVGSLSIAT